MNQYIEMCVVHLEGPAYKNVQAFGQGQGRITLENLHTGVSNDLFNEDFVRLDPADQLIRQQSKKLVNLLNDLVKSKHLESEERKLLHPGQPFSGTLPEFHGLPKLHKLGSVKIRLIIASCDLFSDKLMQKLPIFCSWTGGTSSGCEEWALAQAVVVKNGH